MDGLKLPAAAPVDTTSPLGCLTTDRIVGNLYGIPICPSNIRRDEFAGQLQIQARVPIDARGNFEEAARKAPSWHHTILDFSLSDIHSWPTCHIYRHLWSKSVVLFVTSILHHTCSPRHALDTSRHCDRDPSAQVQLNTSKGLAIIGCLGENDQTV